MKVSNDYSNGVNISIIVLTLAQFAFFCAFSFFLLLLHQIVFMLIDIVFVGYIAGACTAVAQFPQAYKVIKTGETNSISLGMYVVMTFGVFCWLLYGVLLNNLPMILSNGVSLIPSLYILYITIRNLNRNKK